MEALKKQVAFLEKKNNELEQKLFELQERFNEFSSSSSSSSSKAKKEPSEKKSNHPGPGVWNDFVDTVRREILEENGYTPPDDNEEMKKMFKLKIGMNYKLELLPEAAKRKAAKEGREFVPKAKKNDGSSEEKEEEGLEGEGEEDFVTEDMRSIGCIKKKIDDVVYYFNPKSKEVFDMDANRLGKFLNGKIDETK